MVYVCQTTNASAPHHAIHTDSNHSNLEIWQAHTISPKSAIESAIESVEISTYPTQNSRLVSIYHPQAHPYASAHSFTPHNYHPAAGSVAPPTNALDLLSTQSNHSAGPAVYPSTPHPSKHC